MEITKNPILQETAEQIDQLLGPRLDSLKVERAALGLFFSGVKLSSGHGGLCFTPVKEIPQAVCCPSSAKAMPLSGRLGDRPVRDYLKDLTSDNILRKALAIATLNALSALCWEEMPDKPYTLLEGKDAFDDVDIHPGQNAVVIGALVPVLKRLIQEKVPFRVLELDSSTLKGEELNHYAPANEAPQHVPHADLLVITGTTLINDTLPELLNLAKPGAQIIVTGPTASMLPEAFFKRGVTVLGGILVTKPDELLDLISEGGSGYHFFGKSAERLIIRA